MQVKFVTSKLKLATKVFHIAKWYPERNDSLSGVFVREHVKAVHEECECVAIYCATDPNLTGNKFEIDFSVEDGVPTYRGYYKKNITGISVIDKFLKVRLYFKTLKEAYRQAEKEYGAPDVLHVHVLLRTGLFAKKIARKKKIPFIISEHWSVYLPHKKHYFSRLRSFFTKRILKSASAITAVSEQLLNGIKSLGVNGNYHTVPNVIDPNKFSNTHYSEHDKIRLLHVSEFNEGDKNVLGILSALETVGQTTTNFEFHLVGYGAAEKRVLDRIKNSPVLKEIVQFHGKVTGPELSKRYGNSDAFVLFSHSETFACVIIEALSSGTAVISSDVGIAAEVITDNNGIIVAPGDEKALTKAMIDVINKEKKFNRIEVAQSFEQKYDPTSIGKQFHRIYQDVISNN